MKTVFKKMLSLMLVVMLLVSLVPAAFAAETETTDQPTTYARGEEGRENGRGDGGREEGGREEGGREEGGREEQKEKTYTVNVKFKNGATKEKIAEVKLTEEAAKKLDVAGAKRLLNKTEYANDIVRVEVAERNAVITVVLNKNADDYRQQGRPEHKPEPERAETYSVTVKFKNGATKEKVAEVKLTDDEAEDLNVAGAKKLLNKTEYAKDIVDVDVNERTNVITVRVNKNADDYRHNDHDKNEHDKNEHDKNEHDKNEHDKNDHKVTLRVYTNGDTRHADRVFDLDAYDNDGKITRNEVEKLLDSKYHAKSGHTLAYYGLFTERTWDDGRYDIDDAVSSVKVNERGETVVYVMIKNVKKAVADSSNPKTGDNIMIAATTMALTAAALVSMIELKKRKMI